MTQPCPTSGFQCVDQLVSRVDIVAAQALLVAEFARDKYLGQEASVLIEHLMKISAALLEAVEHYTEGHGNPPLIAHLEAAHWYALRGVQ